MKLLLKLLMKGGTSTPPAFQLVISSPVNASILDDRGSVIVT